MNKVPLNKVPMNKVSLNKVAVNKVPMNKVSMNKVSINKVSIQIRIAIYNKFRAQPQLLAVYRSISQGTTAATLYRIWLSRLHCYANFVGCRRREQRGTSGGTHIEREAR